MGIPILNAGGRIIGWTEAPPRLRDGTLVHEGAASLLKADIATGEVVLTEAKDLRRANAPKGWTKPWRCLAICPAASASQFGAGEISQFLSTFPGGGGGQVRLAD